MSWLVLGLFVSAVAVLVAAEWPRLCAAVKAVGRELPRLRKTEINDELEELLVELDEDREAFTESVTRDLKQLPTIDDRD